MEETLSQLCMELQVFPSSEPARKGFQVHFSSALGQPSVMSEQGKREFGVIRKFV